MKINTKAENEKPIVIFGDVSNRLFAFGLDLTILYFPITFLTSLALALFFDIPNQMAVTQGKVLSYHPEFAHDMGQMFNFIAKNYPQDLVLIIRQFIFALTLQFIFFGLYVIPLHWKFGQTLGKKIIGLRVVDVITGEKISLAQAVIRYLGCVVSLGVVGMGIIFGGMRRDKRTWHDFIADTVVIYDENRWYKKYLFLAVNKVRKFFNTPR